MIVSILTSIIIWGLIAVIICRTLHFSGLISPKTNMPRSYNFLCADLRITPKKEENLKIAKIFFGAIIFRLIIFILETVILMMFTNQDFTFVTFLRRLEIWDCTNYVRIASSGYSGFQVNGAYTTLVFFPLYPYTAKILNLFIHNLHISLLLTSTLSYATGCVFLYKLCTIDYDKETAQKAVIYTSISPFAFFFGTMMNESMLFMTSVIALYYIRKHNWKFAGIFGALAALSRMVGLLVAVAAAVEWLEHYRIFEKLRHKQIKEVWRLFYSKGAWIFLMLTGLGIYLLCNYIVAGDFFKFLEYQNNIWGNGSCYFGTGISNIVSHAFDISDRNRMFSMWLPYLAMIILSISMMIYGVRRNRTMYSAYFIAYFILNACISYPISGCRYTSCIVPLYIVMADLAQRHKNADKWITAIFAISFGVYLVAYLQDMVI